MRNFFIYNGIHSSDYGCYIDSWNKDDAPERVVENVAVPGRNGTVTIDGGRYENIVVPYKVFIDADFAMRIPELKGRLLADSGYHRLEDTIHPEEYRMAKCVSGLSATESQERKKGYFDLKFDCMPQRFLKSGETVVTLSASGKIYNPTQCQAKPLLKIYGTGDVYLNNQKITIRAATNYTYIDCEIMEAYNGSVNCNANVTLPDELFLTAGENTITLSQVSGVEIKPRWWMI